MRGDAAFIFAFFARSRGFLTAGFAKRSAGEKKEHRYGASGQNLFRSHKEPDMLDGAG
jgi:hypothetical protein